MKYHNTTWTLSKLYQNYKKGNIDLSPPYQRNFIWSLFDQQTLIKSIIQNIPIPTFFLLQTADGKYQMVDGQQRSRTIISFIDKGFPTEDGYYYDNNRFSEFLNFVIPVSIITSAEEMPIERFYALVNKTGVHLNKPEVRKADFYDTRFLDLVNSIALSSQFTKLKIFTESTLKRMNDIEFISELIVLIRDGHVDKKGQLDEYFKTDIRSEEVITIKSTFTDVLNKLLVLNTVYPIYKTRYKQRNDFYTLFDFILGNDDLSINSLKYFYKILVLIGADIKPTQENCPPLQDYARNCVTQSNSKTARDNRVSFFNKLFLNTGITPNAMQKQLLKFYNLSRENVVTIEDYTTLDADAINEIKKIEF